MSDWHHTIKHGMFTELPAAPKRPRVDVHSFELAEHFLNDAGNATEDNKWSLAEVIQTAVEDWFSDNQCPAPEFVRQNRASPPNQEGKP